MKASPSTPLFRGRRMFVSRHMFTNPKLNEVWFAYRALLGSGPVTDWAPVVILPWDAASRKKLAEQIAEVIRPRLAFAIDRHDLAKRIADKIGDCHP